jgi:hypothetical protein
MTAMDVWLLSCMGFVAAGLLEFAALLWIKYERGGNGKKRGSSEKEKVEVDKRCRRLDRNGGIYQMLISNKTSTL